jgi:cell division septation protein DedD
MTNNSVPPGKPYIFAFSTGRLVSLVCLALALIVLSFMLGIRVERHQQPAKLAAYDSAREATSPVASKPAQAVPGKESAAGAKSVVQPVPLNETEAKAENYQKKQAAAVAPKSKVEETKKAAAIKTVKPVAKPPEKNKVVAQAPKPAPKPVPAPKKVESQRLHYAIQVASSQDKMLAETQKTLLNKKGFTSYIEEINLESKGRFYRVMIGPFPNKSEASRVKSQLTKDTTFAGSYVRYLP